MNDFDALVLMVVLLIMVLHALITWVYLSHNRRIDKLERTVFKGFYYTAPKGYEFIQYPKEIKPILIEEDKMEEKS